MGGTMKNLLVVFILIFSAKAMACTYRTSTTSMSAYQIEDEAKSQKIVLCVDSDDFYSFQLEDIVEAGATLRIFADKVNLYPFQIEDFAEAGRVAIVVGKKDYYSFQLEDFMEVGARIRIRTSLTDLYPFQLEDIAEKGSGGWNRLVLVVDDEKFYSFQLEDIEEAGAKLVYR